MADELFNSAQLMGSPSGNAQMKPQMGYQTANMYGGDKQAMSTNDVVEQQPKQQTSSTATSGQSQDYSGGNPYLKGLNYTTNPAVQAGSSEQWKQQFDPDGTYATRRMSVNYDPNYHPLMSAQAQSGTAGQQPSQSPQLPATNPNPYAQWTPGQMGGPYNQAGFYIDQYGVGRMPVYNSGQTPQGVPNNALNWWQQSDYMGNPNGAWNWTPNPVAQTPYNTPQNFDGRMYMWNPGQSIYQPMSNGGGPPMGTGNNALHSQLLGGGRGPTNLTPFDAASLGQYVAPQMGGRTSGAPVGSHIAGMNFQPVAGQAQAGTKPTTAFGGGPLSVGAVNGYFDPTSGEWVPGGTQGGGQPATPAAAPPPGDNTNGTPNTYTGAFYRNAPQYNSTVDPGMFSGNEGPRPYSTGMPINGMGVQPTLSPGLTNNYFQWLWNQSANLGAGVGATPYGQQSVFLPGFGEASMQGLTSPIDPQLRAAQGAINDTIGGAQSVLGQSSPQQLAQQYGPLQSYMQNAMQAANSNYVNPQTMQAQYNPLLSQASGMMQFGGAGYPGQQLSLQSQYGALGDKQQGAQTLQGLAAGEGFQGAPGQYINSATNTGGFGTPGSLQTQLARTGQIGGQGNQTLTDMASNGQPIDQTDAWSKMVAAMQRNQQQNQAQIAERAAQTGNLAGGAAGGGSGYNQAMVDYMTQANAQQNALLGQMQSQALENARGRQLQAAGQLQGGQLGALNNLSAAQQNAGLYGAGAQMQAANQQQQYMQNALGQMNQNQLAGLGYGGQFLGQSQALPYNLSNQSVNTMLGAGAGGLNLQNSALMNPYQAYNQTLSNLYPGLNQGAQMGQYFQGQNQAAIDRQLQEFMRTQPEYFPLLNQLFGGATTFPGMISPNATSGVGAVIGSALGAAPGIINAIKSGGNNNGNTP